MAHSLAPHFIQVAHQFDSAKQQRDAATLGMWIFLATEVMFFGGLFTTYSVYRALHPFAFAEVSRHLNITLGTINTAVLIGTSFTMALAVFGAQHGRRKMLMLCLSSPKRARGPRRRRIRPNYPGGIRSSGTKRPLCASSMRWSVSTKSREADREDGESLIQRC